MGDVADILGMGSKGPVSVAEEASRLLGDKPKSGKFSKKSKPKGMSRELFSLIGSDGITPVVVTNKSGGPVFKTKRFSSVQGKWIWASFRNPARSDNQVFYHWVKSDLQNVDYSYARFNVKIEPVTYSDLEYDRYLHDSLWTRSETDHLMSLCYKYDLRWPVIVDRYDCMPPRTTEDLQARYYGVIVRLRDARANMTDVLKRVEAHSVFDLDYERVRRTQQELLFRKTREDESEEARLREELKAIDANIKKLKKSAKLMSSGADKASSKAELRPTDPGQQSQPAPGYPCLMSSRLLASESGAGLSKSLVKKTQILIKELLSVPDTNLLPTKAVCDMFDQVRSSAVCLLTLQTALAKKEREAVAVKAQFPSLFPGGSEVLVPHSQTAPAASDIASLLPSSLLSLGIPLPTNATAAASAPPVKLASAPTSQQATKQPKKNVTGTKRKTPSGSAAVPSAVQPDTVIALEPLHVDTAPVGPQKHASKKMKK